MLKGLLPPFRIGEKRSFIYRDNLWGASPLELVGLAALLGAAVLTVLLMV